MSRNAIKVFIPKRLIHWGLRLHYNRRILNAQSKEGISSLPIARLVDFAIVGAQKAGTTALFAYLKEHPQVTAPVVKEVHFFDNDGFFGKERIDYNAYHKAFPYRGEMQLYGDVTPNYIRLQRVAPRIRAYNPAMKLIAILRHPVDRAYSGWNMRYQKGNEKRSFKKAIDEEIKRIQSAGVLQYGSDAYLARGLYAQQIESLLSNFPKEQLLFIQYEEFNTDNVGVLRKVEHFLGLNPHPWKEPHRANVIRYNEALDCETRDRLKVFFQEDIARVEELLDWNCSRWNV